MPARIFLAIVGAAYVLLGIWCAVSPSKTAEAIGLAPRPGLGQAEYLTVYGGLQIGLGIWLLSPLWDQPRTTLVLESCLLLHAGLVIFRSLAFALYRGLPGLAYGLAAGEWAVLIIAVVLRWRV